MPGSLKNGKIRYLLLYVLLYRLSLDILYIKVLSQSYGYYGFLVDYNWFKYIASWIITLVFSILINKLATKPLLPSRVVIFFLFLISFLPASSFYGLSNKSNIYFFYLTIYWGLILFLGYFLLKRSLPKYKIVCSSNTQKIKSKIFDALTIILGIYVFITSYKYNRLYLTLDLENVYNLRVPAKEYNFGLFSGYLLTWSVIVFTFAAIRYYEKKKWLPLLIIFYLQLLLFSIYGDKTTFFYIPISLFGYKFITQEKIKNIPVALIMLNIISLLEKVFLKTIFLTAFFQFRNLYLPAFLGEQYYQFFSKNPPDMLAQSVFRRFGLVSRYDTPIPNMIGLFTKRNLGYANNGLFGDVYANFGFFGLILYPLFYIGILKILDIVSVGLDIKSYIALIIIMTITFVNIPFFTALLSNGIIFSLALLILLKRNKSCLNIIKVN